MEQTQDLPGATAPPASPSVSTATSGRLKVRAPAGPFGGFRESGSPFKEQGAPRLRLHTRVKTAAVRFAW